MTSITVVTPPAPAVTLVEAKAHLHVDHDYDDALIEGLVSSAISHLDGWTGVLGRALEARTLDLFLDRFPASEIRLPLGPVASVSGVYFIDTDGVEQSVSADDYEIDAKGVEGWIVPVETWPDTMGTVNAVRVRYVAGTGCPAAVKHAIYLLIGHWYGAREAAGDALSEIPLGVAALIAPWRRVGL